MKKFILNFIEKIYFWVNSIFADKHAWVQTISGIKFDLFHVKPENISIEDIAYSLSNICRFNGHCTQFYSVAQHSVYCSYLVPPEHAMEALLHDSVEAYIGDVPKPVKRTMKMFSGLEKHIWANGISPKFDLVSDMNKLSKETKDADVALLLLEKAQIMKSTPNDSLWGPYQKYSDEEISELFNLGKKIGKIKEVNPEQAYELFLERYIELRLLKGAIAA